MTTPAATPLVPLEASLPEPDASTAPGIPAEARPPADEETLLDRLERRLQVRPAADGDKVLDRLERRLFGATAEIAARPTSPALPLRSEEPIDEIAARPASPALPLRSEEPIDEIAARPASPASPLPSEQPIAEIDARPASPASPLPSEQPIAEARDQPTRPSLAARLAAPEVLRQQPGAVAGKGTPSAVSTPTANEAQAVLLRPAAPASSRPERQRAASLRWVEIAAVFWFAGVGLAGAMILHLQGDREAPAKADVEDASSPTRQAASPAATEPARPAPSPATELPRPAPPPTANPKATTAAASSVPTSTASPAVPTPAGPAIAPGIALRPGPAPAVPGTPAPVETRPATAEVAALLARGDELLGTGDMASARLFYERAADAGNAQAALRMGESFDPGFIEQAQVRGAKGDPGKAISWYRRARDLGSAEAVILLKGLEGN